MRELTVSFQRAVTFVHEMLAKLSLVFLLESVSLPLLSIKIVIVALLPTHLLDFRLSELLGLKLFDFLGIE